jgi:hypothetical protein
MRARDLQEQRIGFFYSLALTSFGFVIQKHIHPSRMANSSRSMLVDVLFDAQ